MMRLYYRDGDNWINMPYWAFSYISLGSTIALKKEPQKRLIIGLALPVRAYAAALIAMGIVVSRVKIPLENMQESEFFEYLRTIQSGTSVFYLVKEKWYPGEFVEVTQIHDRSFVHVIWKKGKQKCTCAIPLENARKRIRIVGSTKNDAPEKKISRCIVYNKEFLDIMLGSDHGNEFVLRSRLECTIIGCVNTLRNEIKDTQISYGQKHSEGTLQDVLRVKRFMSDGSAYRSNIVPSNREPSAHTIYSEIPYMTIFDGAISFLKWRDFWRKSHWTVLLDKTEPHFQEAVDLLNQEYMEKRVDENFNENMFSLPKGVETIAFNEYLK
ncbi:MAG: hypothetical protein IBX72_12195 [Nitrospirae bacterium]|nr:hypothetical protein [Nitrospirota bacterium]